MAADGDTDVSSVLLLEIAFPIRIPFGCLSAWFKPDVKGPTIFKVQVNLSLAAFVKVHAEFAVICPGSAA